MAFGGSNHSQWVTPMQRPSPLHSTECSLSKKRLQNPPPSFNKATPPTNATPHVNLWGPITFNLPETSEEKNSPEAQLS